ncbi:MAG TPA: MOSC N-terminal beta barrel domain-containing protein [Nocardioidaceae bacterium]|nr:MOSC N-terminal beta barrel domain-containing protein [Nocardioidaceae bacterium]
MLQVTSLRIAPVKALAAVTRDRVRLERAGVPEDRRLFLLHADGTVATMRQFPELTRVVPDLDLDAGTLTVSLPDDSTARSDLSAADGSVQTTLFGKDRYGRLLPGPVADALSDYVRQPLRLVLADTTGVGWDEGPVSLVGRASADALGAPTELGRPTRGRYRMLVELDGTAAFEEDAWVGDRLRLGQAVVRVTHTLERCVVINYSPSTGARDWSGLRALADERGPDRLTLGVIAAVEQPGEIRVGDSVERLDSSIPVGSQT